MNKNIKMLKCFVKVMLNDEDEIKLITPSINKKSIYDIDYDYLKKKKKTNLLFDIDNTILPTDSIDVDDKLLNLIQKLQKDGFKICIISNNNIDRVKPVGDKLNVRYLSDAKKPNKIAYEKALDILKCDRDNAVMIGDQVMSDIKGANEFKMFNILVDPISNKYNIKTKTSRILQNIMEAHLRR